MLGLATPSSISRDLRTPSPRLSAVRTQESSKKKTSISPLVLPSADGELSKICGSLVEPEERRQQWSCHACKVVFPRDATIYVPPMPAKDVLGDRTSSSLNNRLAATSASQEHYCKQCYADRYALGQCYACTKPVLGSTKEDGKFVKSGLEGRIWHGRCWSCTSCGTQSPDAGISIGMDGTPTCEVCFDMPPVARRSTKPATKSDQAMARPNSPAKSASRLPGDPSASSLSGKATRQGMGAAIAELSRKFGQPAPGASSTKNASPILPQHSGRAQSPVRGLTRSNSITGRARPMTAQFSGQRFNLAAFQPSNIERSDSRSRSASPTKQMMDDKTDDLVCSRCFKGPFEGPQSSDPLEARMISLRNAGNNVMYHSQCFRCAVCQGSLESSTRSFVRLEDGEFAHPSCAPPPTVVRVSSSYASERPSSMVSSASSNDLDHATHQRLPRPTLEGDRPTHNLPSSYLMAGLDESKPKTDASSKQARPTITPGSPVKSAASKDIRRFQPTSGAAPPTRSTLLQSGNASGAGSLNNACASLAVSSGQRLPTSTGRFGKLGGMHVCGGCDVAVSSLEGVPGPRGQSWHRKCLVCSAPPLRKDSTTTLLLSANLRYGDKDSFANSRCGKQLDSSAKVTAEGQLRCRECYDRENARRRLAMSK